MIRVFISYSHRDDDLRAELDTHLTMLRRQSVIDTWVDHHLAAGDELDATIRQELERADIILLLVSSYFLASEYCYAVEMQRAMERHAAGTARVIPVILHPCDWVHAPIGRLKVVPRDGKPVSTFSNRHEAFLQITTAIREAAARSGTTPATSRAIPATPPPSSPPPPARSVGAPPVRLRRRLTDRDRDLFTEEAFNAIARYFEASLATLEAANPGIETAFRRETTWFTATVYADGDVVGECRVWSGTRGFEGGIQFSYDATSSGGFNEQLRIDEEEADFRLSPLVLPMMSISKTLTTEEAAEYYWGLLIKHLDQRIHR